MSDLDVDIDKLSETYPLCGGVTSVSKYKKFNEERHRMELHSVPLGWKSITVSLLAYSIVIGANFVYGPAALEYTLSDQGIVHL